MIEMIRLNNQLVRVTGFRQLGTPEHPVFEVVIQIPGEAANRDFAPLLDNARLALTVLHPDGREEEHEVGITARHLHTAGPEHARLFRHQLRLEPVTTAGTDWPPEIGEEIAALLAQFQRLLDRLDTAGIFSRDTIERRARAINDGLKRTD